MASSNSEAAMEWLVKADSWDMGTPINSTTTSRIMSGKYTMVVVVPLSPNVFISCGTDKLGPMHAMSLTSAGEYVETGMGVPKNILMAISFYRKARTVNPKSPNVRRTK